MPLLARALLRIWGTPEFALASARVGLLEAEASDCPLRVREYRRAVLYLEWVRGRPFRDYQVPSLREVVLGTDFPDEDDEDDLEAELAAFEAELGL